MFELTDQTAIVTGGTRGIGAAISEALLGAGARVLATYHHDHEAAQAFAAACKTRGWEERLSLHCFDVADADAVQQFYGQLEGCLAILVNNSGVRQDALLGMMSLAAWERVLAVNLSGAFHMCKHAVRAMMAARYGRIVNVTSPAGKFGFPGQANYAASKGGLIALTRSLAREVATRGITVNCVSPGVVLTGMLRDLSAEQLDALKREVPMRRWAEPEEIAAAVLFLCSREASYISGAVLPVTGGV